MRKNKGAFAGFIWLATMVLLLAACGNSDGAADGTQTENGKKIIKIGYLPITHAVPLFVESQRSGEFENFELELVKFGTWPDMMDALNTGRIDGASVLITLAMKAKESGIDLKAVALGHRDGNILVGAHDIGNIEELKGKKFAIPSKFSTHNILLNQMLEQNGMEYGDVDVVEMPPAEMPAALSEGRISGYVVAEPFGAISVALDKGKVLYQSGEVWENSIDCALVMRSDFLKDNETEAEEFIQEYVKAGAEAEKKGPETHEAASKFMDADQKVMDMSLEWISYDDLRINEESYNELLDNISAMDLLENPPSYRDFVDNSFLDKAE